MARVGCLHDAVRMLVASEFGKRGNVLYMVIETYTHGPEPVYARASEFVYHDPVCEQFWPHLKSRGRAAL